MKSTRVDFAQLVTSQKKTCINKRENKIATFLTCQQIKIPQVNATRQCHNFLCKSLFHSLINRGTHPTERHIITDENDDSQDSNKVWPSLLDENRSDYNNKNALPRVLQLPLVKVKKGTMDVILNDLVSWTQIVYVIWNQASKMSLWREKFPFLTEYLS